MDQAVIKLGAGCVVIKDGMTLLAKRKGKFATGMWGSMGGHVEFGESPTEAAIREAKEELGIEVGNLEFVQCMSMMHDGKHYLDVSFKADIISGEPTIMEPDKIAEIGWFPLTNLPSPMFPPVSTVLDAITSGNKYLEIRE